MFTCVMIMHGSCDGLEGCLLLGEGVPLQRGGRVELRMTGRNEIGVATSVAVAFLVNVEFPQQIYSSLLFTEQ